MRFHKKEYLERAQTPKMFRTADGHQKRLKTILDMIKTMNWDSVSEEERRLLLNWHSEGHTAGEISILL
ncbi:MAG: hypothetical protein ACW98J_03915 [Candidatus Thorarchaeota archaeon]|jgi:hypothetical protein